MLKWIVNLIGKNKAGGYGEPVPKYKFGLIIPHNKKAQGAESPSGVSEYKYALEMAPHAGFKYYTRDEAGVLGASKNLAKWGISASLEPHLNAYNGKAKGFEILALATDSESIKLAEFIAEEFKQAFPGRVIRQGNGVKKVVKGDRGYQNLIDAKKGGMKIALLSEAFFIDNASEWIDPKEMAAFWKSVLV